MKTNVEQCTNPHLDHHLYYFLSSYNDKGDLSISVEDAFPVTEADEDDDVQQDTAISLLNKKRLTPRSILLCNTICPLINTIAGARQEWSDQTAHGT